MNHLIPAEFHGTQINIIDHASRKWLTAEQVGRCLGYDESNSRKGVLKVYERHGDEFSEQDTCIVNLTTQGQGRATRIFSDTGCIKIGFFANTPSAKDFRTWASNKLAHQSSTDAMNHQQIALATQVGQLTDMVRSRDAIITAKDSVIMGLQDRLIGSQGRQIRLIGQVVSMQKRQRDREIIQLIERMEIEGKPRSDIVAMTGKPSNYIRQRLLIARREGRITTPQGSLNLEGGAA